MEKLYYESSYRNVLHRTYLWQEKQMWEVQLRNCAWEAEFLQMVLFFGGGDFISQQAPQEVLKIKLAPTLLQPYSKPNIRPTLKSRVRVNFVFFIFWFALNLVQPWQLDKCGNWYLKEKQGQEMREVFVLFWEASVPLTNTWPATGRMPMLRLLSAAPLLPTCRLWR